MIIPVRFHFKGKRKKYIVPNTNCGKNVGHLVLFYKETVDLKKSFRIRSLNEAFLKIFSSDQRRYKSFFSEKEKDIVPNTNSEKK